MYLAPRATAAYLEQKIFATKQIIDFSVVYGRGARETIFINKKYKYLYLYLDVIALLLWKI